MPQTYRTRHLTARDNALLAALDKDPRYRPLADKLRSSAAPPAAPVAAAPAPPAAAPPAAEPVAKPKPKNSDR